MIIVSGATELLLLAAAILAGAPVATIVRTAVFRSSNALLVVALGVTSWVAVGIVINRAVLYLPGDGQFVTGPLRIGDTDFNITVFAPMIVVSLTIVYLTGRPIVAAYRGRSLRACLRLRPALARADPPRTARSARFTGR